MDLSGIGASATGLFTSLLFWVLFIILILGGTIGAMAVRKKAKFKYPTIIQYDLGNGKIGVEKTKSGWFRSKKTFFGLLDYAGERRLETKDKRIVQQGSTQDFHEINFKRGLIVYAKPDDPKVLLPVKRIKIENNNLVEAIAPADFRDTSAKILQEAQKETMSNWERIAQYAALGILAIVCLVCIILIIQFANKNISEANEILNQALDKKAKIIEGLNVQTSTTAP